MVWPGAIERYLSVGETIAAWKSIECIMGAAICGMPGVGSSLRLVIEKRIRSPTRARMLGPGTWSPNVQALNFTPGARSITLRSEEHTSELQSLMRISYAVFCLKKKNKNQESMNKTNSRNLE